LHGSSPSLHLQVYRVVNEIWLWWMCVLNEIQDVVLVITVDTCDETCVPDWCWDWSRHIQSVDIANLIYDKDVGWWSWLSQHVGCS
jgi:hypothetical protein